MAKAMRTQCFMVVMKVYLILWRSFEFILSWSWFISMYRDERSKQRCLAAEEEQSSC